MGIGWIFRREAWAELYEAGNQLAVVGVVVGLAGADEGHRGEVFGGFGFGEREVFSAVPGEFAEVVCLVERGLD